MSKSRPIIGIIILDDSNIYGGSEGLFNFYVQQFGKYQNDVIFKPIYPITGELLPSASEIRQFKGFILTGSEFSVNDSVPWIRTTINFIKMLLNTPKSPRLFGICFGHQILAKATGGIVGRNPSNVDIVKTENIRIHEIFVDNKIFKKCYGNQTSFLITEAHGESVLSIPENCNVVGSSESCHYEIVLWNENSISVQGHPEFNKNFIMNSIIPLVRRYNRVPNNELEVNIKSFTDIDSERNKHFVISFLLENDE